MRVFAASCVWLEQDNRKLRDELEAAVHAKALAEAARAALGLALYSDGDLPQTAGQTIMTDIDQLTEQLEVLQHVNRRAAAIHWAESERKAIEAGRWEQE